MAPTGELTLDMLKRSRCPVQREITKLSEEIRTLLAKPEPDQKDLQKLGILQDMLVTECNNLVVLNQQVADQLVTDKADDDTQDKEYDECRKIKMDYLEVFRDLDEALKKHQRERTPEGSEKSFRSTTSPGFKLPKISIPKFSGEHKDWIGWWSQFRRIDEKEELNATDKFTYLKQAVKENTRAREIIDKYPVSAENYPKAVKALEDRFGKKDILIDVYVRELQGIMIKSIMNKTAKDKERITATQLYDQIESSLNALNSLGDIDKSHWLFPTIESSLTHPLMLAWQRSSYNKEEPPKDGEVAKTKLERILEFLAAEAEAETRIALASKGYNFNEENSKDDRRSSDNSHRGRNQKKNVDLPTAMGLVSLDSKDGCIFCGHPHRSHECQKAKRLTIEERNTKIKESNACFKCLIKGHQSRDCRGKIKCTNCGGRHYELVCYKKKNIDYTQVAPTTQLQIPAFPAYQTPGPSTSQPQPAINCTALTSADSFSASPEVLLPTLEIGIQDVNGRVKMIRAALDTMSGHSYITRNVVENLKIPPRTTATFKHAVFGGATKIVEHQQYSVILQTRDGSFALKTNVFDQEVIAAGIPGVPSRGIIEELQAYGIRLSDQNGAKPVQLLIGGDIAGAIMAGGRSFSLKSGPIAMETKFGWTVMGKPVKLRDESVTYVEHNCANLSFPEAMWSLETIGIMDTATKLSREEEDAATLEHFRRTVTRNPDGRYQVALPWIPEHPPLPDNKKIAEKRLLAATAKLKRNFKYEDYDAIFEEWKETGIIEEVNPEDTAKDVHYLPHRAVIKEDSATTKVRPVFDASCKGFEGPSLNECLVKGPNLLEKIPNLGLRFREDKIAATADIRKAFLMIEMKESDRDYLRFLWWKDESSKEMKIFRHRRVVFGVNCSPFLLNAVIEHHLESVSDEHPNEVEKLRSSLYVDNVVASFSTMEDYEEFREKSVSILDDAKFDLRLWESNVDAEIGPEPTKVLGLKWNRLRDTLFCDCDLEIDSDVITKRTISSVLARVFDPFGMLAPVVMVPKILLQQCWRDKLGWDEEVPKKIKEQFLKWLKEMTRVREAELPRYIGVPTSETEIHVFCDASDRGYAAVAYLRRVVDDEVEVKFLMCRARVTPLEKMTINRSELVACEIATRLGNSMKEAMGWKDVPVVYWTDSATAKAWILRDKDWGTFVGNRVKKIKERSSPRDWRHVPGILNPADFPSRGCGLNEFLQSSWWKGPSWLAKPKEEWPDVTPKENEEDIMKEVKRSAITAVNLPVQEPWYSPKRCRFNDYNKIVKTAAWMLRFVTNMKKKVNKGELIKGPLTNEEIDEAERLLFKMIQQESAIKTDSFPFQVEQDDGGLLRVKTKLTYRDDEEYFKSPVILPGKHYLTALLIEKEHKENHGGIQFLMAKLREKVWITGGRQAVKKVVRDCQRCKRFSVKHPDPETASLPENRIRDAAPFEITGIDYAGPLFAKGGKKVWVALYTCAVYRAVHLEPVLSLSTEAFLMSLENFVARRGRPAVIYTDNGTNFVGASRLLKDVDWKNVKEDEKFAPIKWIFSPPSAP